MKIMLAVAVFLFLAMWILLIRIALTFAEEAAVAAREWFRSATGDGCFRARVIRDKCGNPYLVRFTILEFMGYGLKLHTILRSDEDRDLHDHPWTFWTLMLAGGYWEETYAKGYMLAGEFQAMEIDPFKMPKPGGTHWIPRRNESFYWKGEEGKAHRLMRRKWHSVGSFRICRAPYPHRLELEVEPWKMVSDSMKIEDGKLTGKAIIHSRPAVTLVLTFPKKREWGFYTPSGWVKWFKYESRREC